MTTEDSGRVSQVRTEDSGRVSYVLGSLGLICLTPWPVQHTRYVAPLAPFLALALVSGVRGWIHRVDGSVLGPTLVRAIASSGALVLLGVQTFALYRSFGDLHAEVSVLDRTGRLQLPQEYMDALELQRRVRLELEPDHIGVWPDKANREQNGD